MRRFVVPLALFALIAGLFPVLPAASLLPPVSVALAESSSTICSTTRVGVTDDGIRPVAKTGSPADANGQITDTLTVAGMEGTDPCDIPPADPAPWCLPWGGAPLATPRNDTEAGDPVLTPDSVSDPAWIDQVFTEMTTRTYQSLLNNRTGTAPGVSGINATSLAWGLGSGDILRETLGIRLDQSNKGTPALALSQVSGGSSAAIWNEFRAEFAASGAGGVQNPSNISSSGYSVPGPGGIPSGGATSNFLQSSLSGVQRIWMARGTLYPSSGSNTAPDSAWFGGVQKVVSSTWLAPSKTTLAYYGGLTASQARSIASQQQLTIRFSPSNYGSTWRVRQGSGASSPLAGSAVTLRQTTITLYMVAPVLDANGNPPPLQPNPPVPVLPPSQLVTMVTVDPSAVVGGMGYYGSDGKTPYALAAPVIGQDLTRSDPGGNYLPVGPTVSGYASSARAAGLVEPAVGVNGGAGLAPPVEAYVRYPTYKKDPNTGLWIPDGRPLTVARVTSGMSQILLINTGLMASARLYWNARPADRAGVSSIGDYITSVGDDLNAVVAIQNVHRWNSDFSSFSLANSNNRGVTASKDPGTYSLVYYPTMASPYPASGGVTGSLAASQSLCGKETQVFGSSGGKSAVIVQPGGNTMTARAMTNSYVCDMSAVTSASDSPDLTSCWFSWRPFQLEPPKCDPEICLAAIENAMQWTKLSQDSSSPPRPVMAAEGNFTRIIAAPAIVGQSYQITADANLPVGQSVGNQPVAYLNVSAQSPRYSRTKVVIPPLPPMPPLPKSIPCGGFSPELICVTVTPTESVKPYRTSPDQWTIFRYSNIQKGPNFSVSQWPYVYTTLQRSDNSGQIFYNGLSKNLPIAAPSSVNFQFTTDKTKGVKTVKFTVFACKVKITSRNLKTSETQAKIASELNCAPNSVPDYWKTDYEPPKVIPPSTESENTGIYLNATQVGWSFEQGTIGSGGQILKVYPAAGPDEGTYYVDRDLSAGAQGDLSSLSVSFRFDQTPLSYLQNHPECSALGAADLLALCGIGYDPTSRSFFYQIRVRTWWDLMWGDDLEKYPTQIVAFGLPWISASDLWNGDPAILTPAIRPFDTSVFDWSVPHLYLEDFPAAFSQIIPMFDSTWDACPDWLTLGCAPSDLSPADVILAGSDPLKQPGWGDYTWTGTWGYIMKYPSPRPLIDTSIFCGEQVNDFVTDSSPDAAACLINIPVLQSQGKAPGSSNP